MKRGQSSLPDVYGAISDTPVSARGFSTPQRLVDKPAVTKGGTPIVVTRNPTHDFYSSTVQVSTVPQPVVGPNRNRRYLLIQNVGTSTVFLGFGVTPSVTGNGAVQLPPNSAISMENGICPNNEITAVSSTAGTLAILEGRE